MYRVLDALRDGLNRRLVGHLAGQAIPVGVVIEAGSGPASGSSIFRTIAGVRLSVAADLDPAALREARLKDPRLAVVVADIHQLPFRSGSSDLVWNSSTLEHLEDRHIALAEMARVAKRGGHLFVGMPYRYGPLGFQRLIVGTRLGVWIGPVFAPGELSTMMRELGLRPRMTWIYFLGLFVGVLAHKPTDTVPVAAGQGRIHPR